MDTVCKREQKLSNEAKDFPVTMGVNAFRGFMNEFMSSRAEEKPSKSKRKKEKKRKVEIYKHNGHTFLLTIINIPTACEICNSFFMWPIERGLVSVAIDYFIINYNLMCHFDRTSRGTL